MQLPFIRRKVLSNGDERCHLRADRSLSALQLYEHVYLISAVVKTLMTPVKLDELCWYATSINPRECCLFCFLWYFIIRKGALFPKMVILSHANRCFDTRTRNIEYIYVIYYINCAMLFCFRYCYDIFFCLAYWQFTILRSGELDTFQLSSIDFSCNFDTTIIWLFSK